MCDKPSQTALTVWLVTAVVAAVATSCPELWAMDIAKVLQGEWWRLASGHLVHLSWQHYCYDLLALGLVLLLCSRLEQGLSAVAWAALLSVASVSTMLLTARPVDIYGGLSGITAGLLTSAMLRMIVDRDARLTGCALLVAMLVKIGLEQQGTSISGVAPVWQAHCAGAVAGTLVSVSSLQHGFPGIFRRESRRTS